MKRNSGRKLALLSGVVLIVYLSFHLVFGDRGYVHLRALDVELLNAQKSYDESIAARDAIEKKVSPMRNKTLDPDVVEENARDIIGYKRDDEEVILLHD